MVDRVRVDQLLALLARYVRILRSLALIPVEAFTADPRNHGSAERFLQLAIETVLAVAHHVIAARGFEQPTTYAEVFRILADEDVLPPTFAIELQAMARMRNRLVHVYEDVDPAQIHTLLGERLGDFDRFAQHITIFLDGQPDVEAPASTS